MLVRKSGSYSYSRGAGVMTGGQLARPACSRWILCGSFPEGGIIRETLAEVLLIADRGLVPREAHQPGLNPVSRRQVYSRDCFIVWYLFRVEEGSTAFTAASGAEASADAEPGWAAGCRTRRGNWRSSEADDIGTNLRFSMMSAVALRGVSPDCPADRASPRNRHPVRPNRELTRETFHEVES